MSLDIGALKLTDEEMERFRYFLNSDKYASPWKPTLYLKELADAQLAKALWQVADWLFQGGEEPSMDSAYDLKNNLEAAGIPSPQQEEADATEVTTQA